MTAPTLGNVLSQEVVVVNERGLHARAAAKFVRLAGSFDAAVTVTKDAAVVSGESIMGLMMLAATPGTRIVVAAVGPDAAQAVAALSELVANRFDED